MDALYRRGAYGRQALTMTMGFGCNAAGVVATRIIDSPRERLIAIITNNFSLCNGRWPTQILMASIFVGALAPAHLAGIVSAGTVVFVAVLGVGLSLVVSWFLSRSVLRVKPAFSLNSAVPSAAHTADALHIVDRQDSVCALARRRVCDPSRSGDMVGGERDGGWRDGCRAFHSRG
jgi:hypothetical protein